MNRYKWYREAIEEKVYGFIQDDNCLKLSFEEWLVFYKQEPDKWKTRDGYLECGLVSDKDFSIPLFRNHYTNYYVFFVSAKDYHKFLKFWKHKDALSSTLSDKDIKIIEKFAERYRPTPPTSGSNVQSADNAIYNVIYRTVKERTEKEGYVIQ